MKTIIIQVVCIFFLFLNSSLAQKPEWTEYEKRSIQYPESKFLQAFVAAENTKNEPKIDFISTLTEIAKTQLINSIHVSIESVALLHINVENTQTDEEFNLNSISNSKADLVGLKTENYFDEKKNIAYVFVHVEIKQLITYYSDVITNNKQKVELKIEEAQQFLNTGNKQNALKTYYACNPFFREIEYAQFLLQSLGKKSAGDLYASEINNYKIQVNNEISKLQAADNLNLDEVAYFIAFGFYLQLENINKSLYLSELTYQTYAIETEFSERFKSIFEKKIVDTGFSNSVKRYSIKAKPTSGISIYGTYWIEHEFIKIILIAEDIASHTIVASVESKISILTLSNLDIEYIPRCFAKVEMLKNIRMEAMNAKQTIKTTMFAEKPLIVSVMNVSQNQAQSINDIPIKFTNITQQTDIEIINSNSSGIAALVLKNLLPSANIEIIEATIDFQSFLNIDTSLVYFNQVKKKYGSLSARFFLKLIGPAIVFETNEKTTNDGIVKFIEPKVKDFLAENGFSFTNDYAEADYFVRTDAKSRQGNISYSMYVNYVDASIAITDLKTGREIYKNSFTAKGVGSNYNQAEVKAFDEVSKKINTDIALFFKLKKQ